MCFVDNKQIRERKTIKARILHLVVTVAAGGYFNKTLFRIETTTRLPMANTWMIHIVE